MKTRRSVASAQPGFRFSFHQPAGDPPKLDSEGEAAIERKLHRELETWSPVCLEGHRDIINCLLSIGSSRF